MEYTCVLTYDEQGMPSELSLCKNVTLYFYGNKCSVMFGCRLVGVKKKKKSAGGRGVDGQIGRYVRGVQVIDSKDLRRVRSKIASNSRD